MKTGVSWEHPTPKGMQCWERALWTRLGRAGIKLLCSVLGKDEKQAGGDEWSWIATEIARGLSWLKASSPAQASWSLLHPQPFPFLTWALLAGRTLVCVTQLLPCISGKWRAEMAHALSKVKGPGVRPLSSPVFGSHGCPTAPWPQTISSAHQTPILASDPHGCLSFAEGPCCSQLWAPVSASD